MVTISILNYIQDDARARDARKFCYETTVFYDYFAFLRNSARTY